MREVRCDCTDWDKDKERRCPLCLGRKFYWHRGDLRTYNIIQETGDEPPFNNQ